MCQLAICSYDRVSRLRAEKAEPQEQTATKCKTKKPFNEIMSLSVFVILALSMIFWMQTETWRTINRSWIPWWLVVRLSDWSSESISDGRLINIIPTYHTYFDKIYDVNVLKQYKEWNISKHFWRNVIARSCMQQARKETRSLTSPLIRWRIISIFWPTNP